VFVDVSFSKEVNKKESYENVEEAHVVADYLVNYCDHATAADLENVAVMSPFRT
jgi:hypothetical protein